MRAPCSFSVPAATLATFVSTAVPGSALASQESLEALVAAAREEAGAPALGCVVAPEGGEVRIVVDGVRVAGEEARVTASDPWHWGSITKSMTATLVARLVEKGEVDWDDTVGDLLLDRIPDMNLDYGDATFLHLLSHRSGLQANIPLERFARFGQHPENPIADRLEWVKIALSQEPVGPLGESFTYSNDGYIVAGAMLEAATGTSWEELIQREVFRPLGITGAGFGAPPGDAPRGHVAAEDGSNRPVPPDSDNPGALGPAGRVHMPLADMARYLSAHARRAPTFLSRESWEVLHEPSFPGPYAKGWVETAADRRWHNGSNTMWYAEASFDLATGTVAAVVVNDGTLEDVGPPVKELLRRLFDGGYDEDAPRPGAASDR